MADPTTTRSFSGGHFELSFDTHARKSAFVKSYKGGNLKHEMVHESHGGDTSSAPHMGVGRIEPFQFEIGMSAMGGLLDWARDFFANQQEQWSGVISHADFNQKLKIEHSFSDAWMTEFTIPECNGASKEPGYAKISIQPEVVKETTTRTETTTKPEYSEKQKLWLNSAFRLTIDGLGDCMNYVSKVNAMTVKQKFTAPFYAGELREPHYEPLRVEWPTLVASMSAAHAGPLIKWFNEAKDVGAKKAPKTGSLTFLNPARTEELFTIEFFGLTPITHFTEESKPNSLEIKRVQFQLAMERMTLHSSSTGIA